MCGAVLSASGAMCGNWARSFSKKVTRIPEVQKLRDRNRAVVPPSQTGITAP
jgi:hypothetical protein